MRNYRHELMTTQDLRNHLRDLGYKYTLTTVQLYMNPKSPNYCPYTVHFGGFAVIPRAVIEQGAWTPPQRGKNAHGGKVDDMLQIDLPDYRHELLTKQDLHEYLNTQGWAYQLGTVRLYMQRGSPNYCPYTVHFNRAFSLVPRAALEDGLWTPPPMGKLSHRGYRSHV